MDKRIVINCAIESYRKNLRTLKAVRFDEEYKRPAIAFDLGRRDLMKAV